MATTLQTPKTVFTAPVNAPVGAGSLAARQTSSTGAGLYFPTTGGSYIYNHTDFTVILAINPDAVTGTQSVFGGKDSTLGTTHEFNLYLNNNFLELDHDIGAPSTSANNLLAGEWTLVALVYDYAARTAKVYSTSNFNFPSTAEITRTTMDVSHSDLFNFGISTAGANALVGYYDFGMFYNDALTHTELQKIATAWQDGDLSTLNLGWKAFDVVPHYGIPSATVGKVEFKITAMEQGGDASNIDVALDALYVKCVPDY